MEKLQCVVERITFRNESNGYSIIKVLPNGDKNIVAAIGIMPSVNVGSMFNLYGYWKNDPKWGLQFCFERCEETLPATINGIKNYLGGGMIKGIGPVYAGKIVDYFGEKTFDILDKKPDRLSEVPGIGPKRIEIIKRSWIEQKEIKNVMFFLQGHGVSASLATKIYKHYGNESIARTTENPYCLADDIWGIGFKTADIIAKKLGFGHERFERLRSGIFYTLNKLSELGHCFAYINELTQAGSELLEVDSELISRTVATMIDENDLILDDTAIYLPTFYYSETGVAKRLLRLINSSYANYYIDEIDIDEWTKTDGKSIHYDEAQMNAINTAVKNKVLILTGGPGTGKTTTTLGIIRAYQERGAKILLAAPTGRAAKRMSEVTHMEAKTIHRLLEMRPPEGFQKNESSPLVGDVLIVDEVSMVDIILMNALLRAVPENMSLILVGDVDQLPSVGAGKVLSDIINSGVVPVVKLEKIFRQAQKSRIITNAHKINKGEFPYIANDSSDFIYLEEEDKEKAADLIVDLCMNYFPKNKIKSEDVQILTPMRRSEVGSANLNQRLQAALNPDNKGLKHGVTEFRLKDRVMQIRNNYDKGVFNGDIGIISNIDFENDELVVNFDHRPIKYDITELDEIVLAYATTIHKSQGSEFPYVIMPLMTTHFMMLQRNLLYTGVTRAKKGLILVGQKKAIYIAVKNDKIMERNTKLAQRLREL